MSSDKDVKIGMEVEVVFKDLTEEFRLTYVWDNQTVTL